LLLISYKLSNKTLNIIEHNIRGVKEEEEEEKDALYLFLLRFISFKNIESQHNNLSY